MAERDAGQAVTGSGGVLALVFILLVVVTMGASGGYALLEGLFRFTLPFTSDDATVELTQAVAAARAAPTPEAIGVISSELKALAQLTSAERFADSRLPEQGVFYTTMPTANQWLMLLHVLFGAFCMLLGGLQFWPGFRRRYLKLHRRIGMIYIVTVPVSLLTVFAYMALTAPHHLYAHLVGWIALWVFGLLALEAIFMAVRALGARRIFEHQAWMALSFGCLMVAPLFRLDWVLLAWLFPAIDQETLNLVTLNLMLPQALLIAYGLIVVNRQYTRPMRQRPAAALAAPAAALFRRAVRALMLLAAGLLCVNGFFYVAGQGMSSLSAGAVLVPAALIQQEQAVLAAHSWVAAVFALGLGLAFPAAALQLNGLLLQRPVPAMVRHATPLLAVAAGLASCVIGMRIGIAPDKLLLSGGTMYLVNGLVLAGFGLRLLLAGRRGQQALMKESLVFLLCLLPFPSLFFLTLHVMSLLPVPADYITAGQGYVLPAGFSAGLLFVAMIHVVYGQATREHN